MDEQDLRKLWISRIRLMMGASNILRLEVTEEDISSLIDIAFEKARPFTVDSTEITLPYSNKIDLSPYNIEEVVKIQAASQLAMSASAGTDELMFDFQAYTVGKLDTMTMVRRSVTPDINIPFTYLSDKHLLFVSPGWTDGGITIYGTRTIPLGELKDDRVKQWIYSYALALTKQVVGRIRSKAKSTNVPIELDGDTLLNEAQQELQDLETKLNSEQFGPTFILR